MSLSRRLSSFTRVQWLTLPLIVLGGATLWLAPGPHPKSLLGSAVKDAGVVTIGTVFVSLLYEYLLRPERDKKLIETLADGIFGRANSDGLIGIQTVSPELVIGNLERNDELLWVDTFPRCLDHTSWQAALREAAARGVNVRLLVNDPHSPFLRERAEQIVAPGYGPGELATRARSAYDMVARIQTELSPEFRDCLTVKQSSGPLPAPMYLVARNGIPLEGWTSYFLSGPTADSTYLHWGAPRARSNADALGLPAFKLHFDGLWERATPLSADEVIRQTSNVAPAEVGRGYCSSAFFTDRAEQATAKLDMLLHRNLNLASEGVMGSLRRACERGVIVRVLCFSSAADDLLVDEAIRVIPQPVPTSIETLRRTLEYGEEFVVGHVSQWDRESRCRFAYRRYRTMPAAHALFVDALVYAGFRHVWTDAQRSSSVNELYQWFAADSPASEILRSQFAAAWADAEVVCGPRADDDGPEAS